MQKSVFCASGYVSLIGLKLNPKHFQGPTGSPVMPPTVSYGFGSKIKIIIIANIIISGLFIIFYVNNLYFHLTKKLPSWAKKMLAELDKEKIDINRADFSFSQKLKSQIEDCKNKLDKLLDAHLNNDISREEYAEKKEKILNQKIEISERLKVFQQRGYSWLEPAKKFILETNEAKNKASGTDLIEKAQFLKKVGSNLVLADQNVKYFPRGAWKILGNLGKVGAEPRSGEARENEAFPVWQASSVVNQGFKGDFGAFGCVLPTRLGQGVLLF